MTVTLDDIPIDEILDALEGRPEAEQRDIMLGLAAGRSRLPPEVWLQFVYPRHVRFGFAPHHEDFWRWIWAIERGRRARPQLDVWGRGGAKSSSIELGVVALAQRRARGYALYACSTQKQADDHVTNIGTLLESRTLAQIDPELCQRAVTQYGTSKGWKRNRLYTASNFVIDAIGLDVAVRGAKLDDERPDLIILDDIDDVMDSPGVVNSKITTISRSILLAGSADVTVIGVQNLPNPDGVFPQIMDGRAEMLADAEINGPVPALRGAFAIEPNPEYDPKFESPDGTYEDTRSRSHRITGHPIPTWGGQDIAACERLIANVGPTAFRIECQHEKRRSIGGMFDDVLDAGIVHMNRADIPDLVRKTIWVDPAVTDTDSSDAHGIQCDGLDSAGRIYRLRSWEERAAPGEALRMAAEWAYEEEIDHVGIEMNVGADMSGRGVEESWRKAFAGVLDEMFAEIRDECDEDDPRREWLERRRPTLRKVVATSGTGNKAARGSTMHADYERPGRIIHVVDATEPYHEILENALARAFLVKPFDLADAAYWSWRYLRRGAAGRTGKPRGNITPAPPTPGSWRANARDVDRGDTGRARAAVRVARLRSSPDNPFGR